MLVICCTDFPLQHTAFCGWAVVSWRIWVIWDHHTATTEICWPSDLHEQQAMAAIPLFPFKLDLWRFEIPSGAGKSLGKPTIFSLIFPWKSPCIDISIGFPAHVWWQRRVSFNGTPLHLPSVVLDPSLMSVSAMGKVLPATSGNLMYITLYITTSNKHIHHLFSGCLPPISARHWVKNGWSTGSISDISDHSAEQISPNWPSSFLKSQVILLKHMSVCMCIYIYIYLSYIYISYIYIYIYHIYIYICHYNLKYNYNINTNINTTSQLLGMFMVIQVHQIIGQHHLCPESGRAR